MQQRRNTAQRRCIPVPSYLLSLPRAKATIISSGARKAAATAMPHWMSRSGQSRSGPKNSAPAPPADCSSIQQQARGPTLAGAAQQQAGKDDQRGVERPTYDHRADQNFVCRDCRQARRDPEDQGGQYEWHDRTGQQDPTGCAVRRPATQHEEPGQHADPRHRHRDRKTQGIAQQGEAGRSQDQIDAEQQDRRRPEPAGQPAQKCPRSRQNRNLPCITASTSPRRRRP